MSNIEQLFRDPEWIKVKTGTPKTDKILSRIEFLKEVGWKEYTEEMYQKYLKAMNSSGRELVYDNEDTPNSEIHTQGL